MKTIITAQCEGTLVVVEMFPLANPDLVVTIDRKSLKTI